MPNYPPFMNAYGVIPKILQKIKEAKTPDRFTQDYLGRTLGFPGGTPKAFIPLAKRLGLLSSDGAPTELYHQFRNPDHSKGAMARAIRNGYADLFSRNESAHKLDKKGLQGLIVQATGLDAGATTLRSIVGTFESLKPFASFDSVSQVPEVELEQGDEESVSKEVQNGMKGLGLNIAYTFNLVLPKTDDVAVFNAIFRALRDNLLSK